LAKPIMGRFSDKIGRKKPIVLGLVLGGVPMVATQFAVTFPELVVVSVTFGLGFSLVTSSTPPLVSEACRKEVYGSAMGFLGTIMDVGQALGPIVTGFIFAATALYSVSFMSMGLLLFASAIIFSL
jgi:DHA1 family multidrug resistance protein-like MFS transporter